MSTEGRVRWSFGSLELQTAQSQPMVGTPMDVPLPNTVSVAFKLSLSDDDDSIAVYFCAPPAGAPGCWPGLGGLAMMLVISRNAIRSSKRTFCSVWASRSVRF